MRKLSLIPLGKFALIAGISMIFKGTTPYAEFFVYHKLVIPDKAAETVKNILENKNLFISGIFGYLINFITDVVTAWAFYGLLKPVLFPHINLDFIGIIFFGELVLLLWLLIRGPRIRE
jgi:hypothetical protein